MPTTEANGVTLDYELRGDPTDEPLLLVMGLGGQRIDWPSDFVDQLALAGFHVIAFDNRDSGLSTEFDWAPPSPLRTAAAALGRRRIDVGYTVPDMAADAAGLLDALGVGAAHVVGMSMGGMIAQQLTIDRPDLVRSLTSIMSNPGDGRSGGIAARVLTALVRRPTTTRDNAVEQSIGLFEMISGPHWDPDEHRVRSATSVERSFRPVGVARQTAAIVASPDRTSGLERVTAPTLVVHGLLDTLVKPSGGAATARAVRHSRLLAFPDMGHDLPRPRWTEMIHAIRRNADR